MTESRHDGGDGDARWSDTLQARLDAARGSDARREWARWESAALRELSKASVDEVSWAIADGLRLPPLLDGAIEAILASGIDRSAARGGLTRDARTPWKIVRTRDASRPDATAEVSAWERTFGVTRLALVATHVDASTLDARSWASVIAAGLEKELRVGGWAAGLTAWVDTDVVVDPVAALLTRGGESRRLDEARDEAIEAQLDRLRFGVDARSIHEAGGGVVEELACVLAQVAAWLRAGAKHGEPLGETFARLDVSVAIGREPLVEIAKLRAVRGVIAALASASGASVDDAVIRVVGYGSHRELTRRDPWVNLLRGTMVGIAGVLGGVDALEIAPADLPDDEHGEFAARMAIDTHRLLRDEAHLAATADAAGGSYSIEAATEALASAAWQRFREIEAAGGFDAWLATGELHRVVEAGAAKLGARAREGALVLLGSNLHPPKEVLAMPKGEWTLPAGRDAIAPLAGDVRPLSRISLESLSLVSPSGDAAASRHGAA